MVGAREQVLALSRVTTFDSFTDEGVRATVDGRELLIGNARLLRDAELPTHELDPAAGRLADEGNTPMYVAVDGRPPG